MNECKETLQTITGTVSISRVAKPNRDGLPYVLEAKVSINNPEGRDIKFTWIRDGSFPDRVRKNNPVYYLSRDMAGHWITCKVECDGMDGHLLCEPYVVTRNDLFKEYSAAVPSRIEKGDPLEGPQLTGTVSVDRYFFANIYNAKYNDGVVLKASVNLDVQVASNDIQYSWGYVYTRGNRAGLLNEMQHLDESNTLFWCRHKDAVGKIYRCVIRCAGYSGAIIGEYGPVTEEDFKIPLVGDASIKAEVYSDDDHGSVIALKAAFRSNNINSKPFYTWLVGDKQIYTGKDSRLSVNETYLSTPIRCEVTHPTREGSLVSEPFELTPEKYALLVAKLERQRRYRASATNCTAADRTAENDDVEKAQSGESTARRSSGVLAMMKLFQTPKASDYCGHILYQNGSAFELFLRVPDYKGCCYEGVIRHAVPEGLGKLTTEDGYEYVGIWKNGKLTGRGTVQSTSGVRFEGEWVNSYAEGYGKLTYPNGEVYEGPYQKGKKGSGEGQFTFANGDAYIGQFHQGRISGQGKLMLADGAVIEHDILSYLKHHGGYTNQIAEPKPA